MRWTEEQVDNYRGWKKRKQLIPKRIHRYSTTRKKKHLASSDVRSSFRLWPATWGSYRESRCSFSRRGTPRMPTTYFHGTMTKTDLIIKRAIRSRIPAYYEIDSTRIARYFHRCHIGLFYTNSQRECVITRTSVLIHVGLSLSSTNYRWMGSILSDFMNEIVEENIVSKCIRAVTA